MFKNRIRLPFYLSRPQFPAERNVFRDADGNTVLLSTVIRNTYLGKTDQIPEDWHRKLLIALSHKEVTIEDTRLLTDVVIDGDYGIEWQDFLDYPIASANFTVQVTPFNASSNNCLSCSEIEQIELVDDHTDDIFTEDETYDYPFLLTANDSICCYPYTVSLVTFNTLYFNSVSIDPVTLVLSFTVNPYVPILDDVLICTYRVTCENGSYDEANVYGNITGTNTECLFPNDLSFEITSVSPVVITFSWTPPAIPPAGGYEYILYPALGFGTPIYTGNTFANTIDFSGVLIRLGFSYRFLIRSNCGGGDISDPVFIDVNVNKSESNCGKFMLYYAGESFPESVSFINCDGNIQTYIFNYSHAEFVCMIESDTVPLYAVASSPEIIITYIEPC